MSPTQFRSALVLVGLAVVAPAWTSSFDYVGLNDTWPTSGWGSGADWSSDLGPDYRCGWGTDGVSTTLTGDGTGWSSKPLSTGQDSGFDLAWELNRKGGGAGETFSGGAASIAQAGAHSSAFSTMHLYSELGDNSPGLGISTYSSIVSTMGCSIDYQWQPVYYAMDWTVTYRGNGEVRGNVGLGGFGWDYQPGRTLFDGWFTGSGVVSGSTYGTSTRYNNDGTYNYPLFAFGMSIGDNAGAAGSGRLDAVVRFRFSDQPITSVPEPATLAAVGLGVIGLVRRRRAAKVIA